MKIKTFILILIGLTITRFSVLNAETTGGLSIGDDSTSNSNYSGLKSPFLIQPQTAIPVNENEVKAGLLYDVVNGKVVWQKNIGKALPIASLTKMMVALLTVEDVRSGKFTWNDNLKWTRETFVGRRKSRKKVTSEIRYSLKDVFKASMIASNNECAEQMARFISNGIHPVNSFLKISITDIPGHLFGTFIIGCNHRCFENIF